MLTSNLETVKHLVEAHAKSQGLKINYSRLEQLPLRYFYDDNGYLAIAIMPHPYLDEINAYEMGYYSTKNGWALMLEAERELKSIGVDNIIMIDRSGTLDRYYTRQGYKRSETAYTKELH